MTRLYDRLALRTQRLTKGQQRLAEDARFEKVAVRPLGHGVAGLPTDYHCDCELCRQSLGMLIRDDGTLYSRLDRKFYYPIVEDLDGDLPAVHWVRWCIQAFSEPGDRVLDPVLWYGTTAVEALNHRRSVMGLAEDFYDVVMENVRAQRPGSHYKIRRGPGQTVSDLLWTHMPAVDLVVVNAYRLAQMPHQAYEIYEGCRACLRSGGYFCIGAKDPVRKAPGPWLHQVAADYLSNPLYGMSFVGTAFLPYYPLTKAMEEHRRMFRGATLPLYYTILVFRKNV